MAEKSERGAHASTKSTPSLQLSTARWFQQGAAAIALSFGVFAVSPTVAQNVYTMHIGVDDYPNVAPLAGAVNDAKTFERIFEEVGADTALFVEEDATRENIVTRFQEMARVAEPGDTIVFTFAGHGAQHLDAISSTEDDGYDDFLVLWNYDLDFPVPDDALFDNDIADLFETVDEDVTILFIVDSCHSGTMTRSLDPRGQLGRTRQIHASKPFANFSRRSEAVSGPTSAEDLPNVVFIAASREDQLANETHLTGQPRGALSLAIEEVLDRNGADLATVDQLEELQASLVDRVRGLTSSRQEPSVVFDRDYIRGLSGLTQVSMADGNIASDTRGLGRISATGPRKTGEAGEVAASKLADEYAAVQPKIAVGGAGSAEAREGVRRYAEVVDDRDSADIFWDLDKQEMVDVRGADMIGLVPDHTTAERVVEKWRATQALKPWTSDRAVYVRIVPEAEGRAADDRYREGEEVNLEIEWPLPSRDPYPYVTIVNLANGGYVQYIFPAGPAERLMSPEQRKVKIGPFPVTPPFGADHVLVLLSKEPMTELHESLDIIHESSALKNFIKLMDRHASGPGVRLGMAPLFTRP